MTDPGYPGSQVDGVYDRTKPWNRLPKWSYSAPNESLADRRMSEAIAAVTQQGQDLADIVRPPLDIQLFPPRFGYRETVLGIGDMIDIGRRYTAPSDYSGTEAGQQGSARNSWGSGTY